MIISNRLIFMIGGNGKVNWTFLQQVLRMKGFSGKWCQWIDSVVKGGSVCKGE
jgi:hypothetical protein